MIMNAGKYDVMLVAEQGLNLLKFQPQEGWHNCMCMSCKGTFTHLSYNTNNGDNSPWNQYGDIGITINSNMKSQITSKGSDPTKLGRWMWVCIEGKAGEATVFVSAYSPCKNTKGISTVCKQQVRYFQREK